MSGRGEQRVPDDSPGIGLDLAIPCAENVRADERLLREGRPSGRVGVLTDRAISIGIGVPSSVAYLDRARSDGLAVVRRTTGGTAILHAPGDLSWTLVLPRGDPRVGRDYAHAYDRLGAGVVGFLRERGVRADWTPSPGLSSAYCLLGPRGSVLTVGDRILGGAAQHVTKAALLHHGILPRVIDRPMLGRLFDLSASRGLRRLTSLDELGLDEESEVQARRLARALATELARA